MKRALKKRIPRYRLHKPSGQAVVTLDDRTYYLGKHGSTESHQRYDRYIAEWLVKGRQIASAGDDITIVELIAAYWQHVINYYVRKGTPPLKCIQSTPR